MSEIFDAADGPVGLGFESIQFPRGMRVEVDRIFTPEGQIEGTAILYGGEFSDLGINVDNPHTWVSKPTLADWLD